MSQNYFCHTCLCFFLIVNAISICISSRNSKCGTRIQPVRECISQQHHKGRSTRSCATLTWGHWKLHLHIPWLPFIWACYCPLRCVEIDLLAPAEFVIVLFIIYISLSISALHKAFFSFISSRSFCPPLQCKTWPVYYNPQWPWRLEWRSPPAWTTSSLPSTSL